MDLKSPSPGFTRSAGCDIMYNDIALSEMKILMLGLGSLEQKRNYPSAGDNAANINVRILGLILMYLLVENILSKFHSELELLTIDHTRRAHPTFPSRSHWNSSSWWDRTMKC
jgi:hypothetical protein